MAAAESSQDKHRSALRKQCLALRNQIDPALKQAYDACIITRLMQWLEGQKPEDACQALLALWWPIGSEPDWRPFAPAHRLQHLRSCFRAASPRFGFCCSYQRTRAACLVRKAKVLNNRLTGLCLV
ncbi:MAG: hypothetical protein EBW54_02875 [Betaproteobacteria bacterium]|nr:hypothetical protein [Betaproteobacteria bacterium]